jgi:hypothetical protein
LPIPITDEQKVELANLINEKENGINENSRKTKWTDTKEKTLISLQKKEKGEDELSSGIITHLNDVFRALFWKRKRHLNNKFLEKGNICEQDILDLASKIDKDFYNKNDKHFSNDFIQGSWDNFKVKIRDVKASYDLKSFEESELTNLYSWQIKGYSILAKENYKLKDYPEGELIYGLVNNPLSQLNNEKTRQFYAHGNPDDDNENWIEIKMQIERNMVFDIELFKKIYPFYQFENKVLDFSIPMIFRLKKFEVLTTEEDEFNIKRRILMCREYLMKKEIDIYEKIKLI